MPGRNKKPVPLTPAFNADGSHASPLRELVASSLVGKVVKTPCRADAGSGMSNDWMNVIVIGVTPGGELQGIVDNNPPGCSYESRGDLVTVNLGNIYEVTHCPSSAYREALWRSRPGSMPLRRKSA